MLFWGDYFGALVDELVGNRITDFGEKKIGWTYCIIVLCVQK